jgi:hypothetical protein
MRTLHSILFAVAVSACTGSAQIHSEADYTAPQMVEVEPGVQVVADYDQPVFYNENAYWRYDGGVWYRSQYHDRGWARVEAPPVAVRHIQRPEAYVHYHGHAEVRDQRAEAPVVRDHRDENVVTAPAPTPADVRDHREDQHAEVRDQRAEEHDRKDVKQDEKAEAHERVEMKHDEKAEAKDRKEMQKDDKKREKDERKEVHDERKH